MKLRAIFLSAALCIPLPLDGQSPPSSHSTRSLVAQRIGPKVTEITAASLSQGQKALLFTRAGKHELIVVDSVGNILDTFDRWQEIKIAQPVGISAMTNDHLFVLDGRGGAVGQIIWTGDRLVAGSTRFLGLAKASGICALKDRLYVLGIEDVYYPEPIVHTTLWADSGVVAFGRAPGGSDVLRRATYSAGGITCVGNKVVVTSDLHPEVKAFSADGQLKWSVHLPAFIPLVVRRPAERSVLFELPPDSVWDRVTSAVGLLPNIVVIQVERRRGSGPRSAKSGTATHLLSLADGSLVTTRQDLAAVVGSDGHTQVYIFEPEGEKPLYAFPIKGGHR